MWDIHVVKTGMGRFLEEQPYMIMTAVSKNHWRRPIVIVGSRCIRDAGLSFREGDAICILSFYCKIRLALSTESDTATRKRLQDCKDMVLIKANQFKEEIVKRKDKMIHENHDIEHWWILHTIVCWDAGKVEIFNKGTTTLVVLHGAEVDKNVEWIRLHGIAEDSQQPVCFVFDPEATAESHTFNVKLVVAEGARMEGS